jgi:hypothetical protein
MMEYSTKIALKKSKRRAFLLGLARGRRPPTDREELFKQTRALLDQLHENDQYAILLKAAEDAGTDRMVHCASVLLAAAIVLCQRMPVLESTLFINQIFIEGRRLLDAKRPGSFEYDVIGVGQTRH